MTALKLPRNPGPLAAALAAALLAPALAGCVSKSQAQAQARLAYMAGQRDALLHMQQQMTNPTVTFVGPVNRTVVRWYEGLTLTQAIIDAEYTAPDRPARIVIRRRGEEIQMDPSRLLGGDTIPVQPGDVVELQLSTTPSR